MAGKMDDIEKEIDSELHNLSLEELSTNNADDTSDQSLPGSPTRNKCSDVLEDYLLVMSKKHSDFGELHNQSRELLKLTEEVMLGPTMIRKLKDELGSETVLIEKVNGKQNTVAAAVHTSQSSCDYDNHEEQILCSTFSPVDSKHVTENASFYLVQTSSPSSPQIQCDQDAKIKVTLECLEAERKEREKQLAEEQKEMDEKLNFMKQKQLLHLKEVMQAEARFKEEKIQKQFMAATTLQAHWRRFRVQKMYGLKLKELKQRRILTKLKKISEKRRKYHSVPSDKKDLSCNSESTTTQLINNKAAQDQKQAHSVVSSVALSVASENRLPKVALHSNDNTVKGDGSNIVVAEGCCASVTVPTVIDSGIPRQKGCNNISSSTNSSNVIKLCGSPVRLKDAVKEQISRLLQEEEVRVVNTGNANRSLKLQTNFEAGMLHLRSPERKFSKGPSPVSPFSEGTLSTTNSSAIFMSPPVSGFESRASKSFEKSDIDDDDDVTKELKLIDAVVASKTEEEIAAKRSRERMLKAYSMEISNTTVVAGTKKSALDYAVAEIMPVVWYGLIEERHKSWLINHSLWKKGDAPLLAKIFKRSQKFCNRHFTNAGSKRPLSDFQLLSASPTGTNLDQVTQVEVFKAKHEVDLSCLMKCPSLASISLTNCIIPSLSGLVGNNQLMDVSAQSNVTDSMDCSGLSNLMFMDAACNKLSSLHGLKDTHQLLELNLSENRLTRIAHLDNCKSLEKLILDGNLLVNSEGLLSLPNLQHLSLLGNHLTILDSVVNCSLLQYCFLQENNLQEFPSFINSPLLREIYLQQNNLDSIKVISTCFLPLLEILNLSGNCISHLESLSTLVMLHTLDISNNCIADLPEFLQSLKACYEIKTLVVDGNPVVNDALFKFGIKKVLPRLKHFGKEVIMQDKRIVIPNNSFVELCRKQIKEQNDMASKHSKELQRLNSSEDDNPALVVDKLRTKFYHSKERCSLLIRHLLQHEYYDCNKSEEMLCEHERNEQSRAAVIIQACWRGQRVRKWLKVSSPRWLAAVCLQSSWRGYCVRKKLWNQLVWLHRKQARRKATHEAATKIQAHYRGHRLRKRLKAILEQAKYTDGESDDFDYSHEIEIQELDESIFKSCLESLDANESELEKVESLPTSATSVLHQELFSQTNNCNEISKADSPCSDYKTRNKLLDNASVQSFEETLYLDTLKPTESLSCLHNTCVNENIREAVEFDNKKPSAEYKVIKAAEEWGFKDIATAEMMVKRANKYKQPHISAVKAKKMTSSKVRLAQFKAKQQEPVAVKCVHCKSKERKSYFQSQPPTPSPSYKSKDFVYKWVDNQNVCHETLNFRKPPKPPLTRLLSREKPQVPKQCESMHELSTSYLPRMEPHVLAGHVPRLITSKIQNELIGHPSAGASAKTTSQQVYKIKSLSSPDVFEQEDAMKRTYS